MILEYKMTDNSFKSSGDEDSKGSGGTKLLTKVDEKLKDQDFMQRFSLLLVVPLELYRVLISSLLIIFVPQSCSGQLCTMKQNLEDVSPTYETGLVFNFITLGSFLLMYFFEILREHYMIVYLEVNNKRLNDPASVSEALTHLDHDKKNVITFINELYKVAGTWAILMYIVNAIISGYVVFSYNLGNQTSTTFITSFLFMVMKFIDVYWTIRADHVVFYSAYLRTKVQFNDVDPDHDNRISKEV